jgi:hypothetical protein
MAEDNEKLAGWAQAVGAFIAILIAVLIPAYQFHSQNLEKRRDAAELNLTLSMSCFFLMGDVRNHFVKYGNLSALSRALVKDDLIVNTLLQRIHTLENREVNWRRMAMLNDARNKILLTENLFQSLPLNEKMSESEKDILETRVREMNNLEKQAGFDHNHAIHSSKRLGLFWTARMIYEVAPNKTRLPSEEIVVPKNA